MAKESQKFYSDESMKKIQEEYVKVEKSVAATLEQFVTKKFLSERAKEYAHHGLSRRLGVLQRSIRNVFNIIPPNMDRIPTREETLDSTINVQAFIINVFGCRDNLAWILVEEKKIVGDDGKPLDRHQVGFSKKCVEVRKSLSKESVAYIDSLGEWAKGMGDYRDSLAHRIPLYIPPYTVSDENAAEYHAIEQAMNKAFAERNYVERERLAEEQLKLVRFTPWIQGSFGEKTPPIVIHAQMIADSNLVVELSEMTLKELG